MAKCAECLCPTDREYGGAVCETCEQVFCEDHLDELVGGQCWDCRAESVTIQWTRTEARQRALVQTRDNRRQVSVYNHDEYGWTAERVEPGAGSDFFSSFEESVLHAVWIVLFEGRS